LHSTTRAYPALEFQAVGLRRPPIHIAVIAYIFIEDVACTRLDPSVTPRIRRRAVSHLVATARHARGGNTRHHPNFLHDAPPT
jgi:hypothetical protein